MTRADVGTGESARLLVVTQDFGGGTGRHLGLMIRHWLKAGWEVQVICQGASDPAMTRGVDLTPGPTPGRIRGFPVAQVRSLHQVWQRIQTFRPHILHCYFFWSFIYGRMLRALGGPPRLVENREDEGFNMLPWQYRVLRLTAQVPDRVICVSEGVRRVALAREHLSSSAAVVVRNGIAPLDQQIDRAESRRTLGFADSIPLVGLVANLNRPIKGVEYFIDAAPLIIRRFPDARLVIFGDGHLRPALEDRARGLRVHEQVVFAGYRTDVSRLYPAFDVSALTSLSEGLSITLLESMQHGIPVVATAVGGNPELVSDGITGYLVPPRDPAAFADRVCALLSDPTRRRAMGDAARRVVASRFDATSVAQTYLDIFNRLLLPQA